MSWSRKVCFKKLLRNKVPYIFVPHYVFCANADSLLRCPEMHGGTLKHCHGGESRNQTRETNTIEKSVQDVQSMITKPDWMSRSGNTCVLCSSCLACVMQGLSIFQAHGSRTAIQYHHGDNTCTILMECLIVPTVRVL